MIVQPVCKGLRVTTAISKENGLRLPIKDDSCWHVVIGLRLVKHRVCMLLI